MYQNTWIIVLAFACSVAAQHQQQPNAIITPTQPQNQSCNATTTKPSPKQESYVFEKCIVAKFSAYFSLGSNEYFELKDGVTNTTISQCEPPKSNGTLSSSKLVVDFGTCAQLKFDIARDNTSHVYVQAIDGWVIVGNETLKFANSTPRFETSADDHYYKCNSEQSITTNLSPVQLVVSNLALEAFRKTSGTEFYKLPEECALDSSQVSDLVRIGVGICLVALVALVLIAYFVGRRRWSERSSYESV